MCTVLIMRVQGSVYGRIDVFRAIYVILDHLTVTSAKVYRANRTYESYK